MTMHTEALKKTPLTDRHIAAGARMVPFSGWNMPVQYSGIINEHVHTRKKAGLFDICHMGEFTLTGPAAERDLSSIVTCRVDDMLPGKCRYGLLLNNKGGIIDDLIIFKKNEKEFMLVVNSATTRKDKGWILAHLSPETVFEDISDETAKIDIQGPLSCNVVQKALKSKDISAIKRFSFEYVDFAGTRVLLSRTGYTGELGYELFFRSQKAEELWDVFGGIEDVLPVGLGARDTLRLEMGFSLYGNDIDEAHTPIEANLSRFVCMEKEFIGRGALREQQEKGIKKELKGFICEGRRSARGGFDVIAGGAISGKVTSGAFSPSIQKGIGLCYINTDSAREGQDIILTNGKMEIRAEIKEVPLYRGEQKSV